MRYFTCVLILLFRSKSGAGFVLRPKPNLGGAAASTSQTASTSIACSAPTSSALDSPGDEYDVVIIGGGIGGLCTAALVASTGLEVCVCESHDAPGGAAHEWVAGEGFHFESGPSLYAGLSLERSPNPLKHVFQIIGEEPEWITYDRWGTYLPEGDFAAAVGSEDFMRKLAIYGGSDATEQWTRLMARIEPLGTAIFGLPSAAVRSDGWAALTLGVRYFPALMKVAIAGGQSLQLPFSRVLEEENITDPFILHWLDMICFLLQGATTKDAPTTLMAYMLSDFYREGVVLDFPKGGTKSIIDALVRGITKHSGCTVRLNAHVEGLAVSEAVGRQGKQRRRVNGVVVRSGSEGKRLVSARKAVVSNCDLWSTRNIALGLPATPAAVARSAAKDGAQQEAGSPETKTLTAASVPELAAELESRAEGVGRCDSFLHLHLGIDGEGLPTEPSEAFPAQWAVIDSWEDGVDAPRNLVLVSMASLLDPTLAPKGCHVIHAYVPATEPYETWEGLDRRSVEYRKKKAEAAEVLWRAIEKQIPDVRERAKLTLVGTPLTHERFLRRDRGTYGAFVRAGDGQLPGQAASSVEGFYMCGDSTFPGIGVPAVAASGLIAANSIVSVQKHWEMLDRIRL